MTIPGTVQTPAAMATGQIIVFPKSRAEKT